MFLWIIVAEGFEEHFLLVYHSYRRIKFLLPQREKAVDETHAYGILKLHSGLHTDILPSILFVCKVSVCFVAFNPICAYFVCVPWDPCQTQHGNLSRCGVTSFQPAWWDSSLSIRSKDQFCINKSTCAPKINSLVFSVTRSSFGLKAFGRKPLNLHHPYASLKIWPLVSERSLKGQMLERN